MQPRGICNVFLFGEFAALAPLVFDIARLFSIGCLISRNCKFASFPHSDVPNAANSLILIFPPLFSDGAETRDDPVRSDGFLLFFLSRIGGSKDHSSSAFVVSVLPRELVGF